MTNTSKALPAGTRQLLVATSLPLRPSTPTQYTLPEGQTLDLDSEAIPTTAKAFEALLPKERS